jgi:hypothetical protein
VIFVTLQVAMQQKWRRSNTGIAITLVRPAGFSQLKMVPVWRRASAKQLLWLADAGVGLRYANPTYWKCSMRKHCESSA